MNSISENMVRRLAYEERLCLYRLFSDKKNKLNFNSDDLKVIMHKVANFTEINVKGKNFNINNIYELGLENCIDFFSALCEQYKILKDSKDEFSDYRAHGKRIGVVINSLGPAKLINSDIGLYNSAKVIDGIVQDNFRKLRDDNLSNNTDDHLMKLAVMTTFASMYYQLRDVIEGKSYYDGKFLNEYRELPVEYEKSSLELLEYIAKTKSKSVFDVKKEMLGKLDQGINDLITATQYINQDDKKSHKL